MTNLASDKEGVAGLTLELSELRSRQEGVADILRALSSSGLRLQPILDQIVETAARLCRADSGFLYLVEGDLLRMRANFGQPEEVVEHERQHPDRPGPQSCTGRVAMTNKPVHIPDVHADPEYTYPGVEIGGYRTLLGLPVAFDDELLGVIGLARSDVQPFEAGEIELMATFADQGAIAIANAKLFETVERQKSELARFLSPEVAALISSDEGAQLLAGHRAYITVVYFDLRGFTAFAETAEPEELIDVIRQYHAAAGELVLAHGGTLEHFAGDGLMVFFNDPVPIAEPELQAAKLALAMRERIGELAEGWRKRGYELGLGAGVAVGHATLGRIGFEGRYDYGALGSVTNLAARLSDEAASGKILLSQRAYAALEGRVEASPVAELQVKGFARPVQAFELLRVVDRASA
jgi:class 3 adenylate cyclase